MNRKQEPGTRARILRVNLYLKCIDQKVNMKIGLEQCLSHINKNLLLRFAIDFIVYTVNSRYLDFGYLE